MKPSFKVGIITGIAVGLFAITCFSIFNWLNTRFGWGLQPATIRGLSGLLTIVIQGTGIYFSMKGTKAVQNGRLTYRQALKAGFTVAIITALITAFFGLIYCTVINPGYADYMINEARKAMLDAGKSAKQIADGLVGVRREFSIGGQVMEALIAQTVVGTIISLIMSFFMKSKRS